MRSITLSILFSCLIAVVPVTAQVTQFDSSRSSSLHLERFQISPKDSLLQLQHQFIIPSSEIVRLDSFILSIGKEYILDSRFGTLQLFPNVFDKIYHRDSLYSLIISYQALPFSFKDSYRRRIPVIKLDTLNGTTIAFAEPTKEFSLDDLFGSDLQKSGSIVRGFSVGSNRDLSLNSGFRIQMAGSLSRDIAIVAALTDQSSPLQPEGTTKTLQEIDKVFVEVRGKNMSATLGDFSLDIAGSEFGRLNRKLQGARLTGSVQTGESKSELDVTVGAPRGKFTTNQFQGLDGVQGPYRLTGQNNERDIVVIAGTERAYINGVQVTRGELYDYTIDYALAEITFVTRRRISSTSRITIDFEYTDRQYNRNLLAAHGGTSFFGNHVSFGATFLRETDDMDSPLDLSLSDEDKQILQQAGNDRSKAVRSGVDSVGVGKGQYEAVDTLLHLPAGQDTLLRLYRYNPIDTLRAAYSLNFSFVGFGKGDYDQVTTRQYRFVGVKQGSYLPIRFLPMPKEQTLTDFTLEGKPWSDLTLGGEFSISSFDVNRFSSLHDNENVGHAMKFTLAFNPQNVRVGHTNIGTLNLLLNERLIDKRYVSPDRINDIEFNRKWNITDTSRGDESIHEGIISYQPVHFFTLGGSGGFIRRGEIFASDRYSGTMKLNHEYFPKTEYHFEFIKSNDNSQDMTAHWIRHHGSAEYRWKTLTPRVMYNGEVLWSNEVSGAQSTGRSFRYNEFISGLLLDSIAKMSFNAEYTLRLDDSLAKGSLRRATSLFTQSYGWRLSDWNAVSSSLDLALERKTFDQSFRKTSGGDYDGLLVRSQTQLHRFERALESDFFYEISTGRSAKMERVFQRVPIGTGNYAYVGDINNNHVVDEQDFQLTRFDGNFIAVVVPTDQLIPIVNLKASTRIRLSGERFFPQPTSWIERAFSTFSSETYARVEENSSEQDKKQIYLLHFSRFLNDYTTLSGNNFIIQDIFFQENNPLLSLRLRYSQQRSLTQFALGMEHGYMREQSIRLRWHLVKEFSNQTDFIQRKNILSTDQLRARERDIEGNSLITDWSYRPEQRIELGFKFSFGQATNFDSTVANLNNQSVRLNYSLNDRGQVGGEFVREEATLRSQASIVPFELTGGVAAGKSWLWKGKIDYRIASLIQCSVDYDGRSQGGVRTVHTVRAEVRAFF